MSNEEKLQVLEKKIAHLKENFQIKIRALENEVSLLKQESKSMTPEVKETSVPELISSKSKKIEEIKEEVPKASTVEEEIPELDSLIKEFSVTEKVKNEQNKGQEVVKEQNTVAKPERNLEDFIGGNLIGKIGILVLLIGIAIFVKYASDQNWISETMRVLLAYMAGGVLFGLSLVLKKKYKTYSAVLLAGGIATFYFTTYLGFLFYTFPSQLPAFGIMFLATAFSIYQALKYDEEVVGMVGLVAAYVIPILLSDGGGKVWVLYTYMSILNAAVLFLGFHKNWHKLIITAFVASWLIFGLSIEKASLVSGMVFCILFFLIFSIGLVNETQKENHPTKQFLFFLNSLIVYGLGIALLQKEFIQDFDIFLRYVSVFTFLIAVLHFILGLAIGILSPQKFLVPVIISMAIVWLTVSIPIYFVENPHISHLLWLLETIAVLAFARVLKLVYLERLSIILATVLSFSLMYLWSLYYFGLEAVLGKLWNENFGVGLASILALIIVFWIHKFYPTNQKETHKNVVTSGKSNFIRNIILATFILAYLVFFLEVYQYLIVLEGTSVKQGLFRISDTLLFTSISLFIYSAIFLTVFISCNHFIWKDNLFYQISFFANFICILLFLVVGLNYTYELVELFVEGETTFSISIRWIAYLTLSVLAMISIFIKIPTEDNKPSSERKLYIVFLNIALLILLSFELHNYFLIQGFKNHEVADWVQKLGFTVLWACHSLLLIGFGIWRKRKFLRFAGFIIFGITLGKLFLYDITYISTASKIISFIAVGILLLVTSFLYQKYKHIILADDE